MLGYARSAVLLLVILGTLSLASKSAAIEAVTYSGELGTVHVTLSPNQDQHSDATITGYVGPVCGGQRANISYNAEWSNPSEGVFRLRLISDRGIIGSGDLMKRTATEDGLRFIEWFSNSFLFNGHPQHIALRRALDENSTYIPNCTEGKTAGSAWVLFKPAMRGAFEAWLRQRGFSWQQMQPRNMYHVDLPFGSDHIIISQIRNQSWALDATRERTGAGPEDLQVEFTNSIFKDAGDYALLKAKLTDLLRRRFPKANITDDTLKPYRKGLSYQWQILAPASTLGASGFDQYWVKTQLILQFFKESFFSSGLQDTVEIKLPDGWLARWPSRDHAPPEGHFDHLSREGQGKFRNFDILLWLGLEVQSALVNQWHGVAN